jgi:hypothetical protein
VENTPKMMMMVMMNMNVNEVLSGGISRRIYFIYTCEDTIMKPTKHCLKKVRGGRERNGNIMEAINLFKVYYMHV